MRPARVYRRDVEAGYPATRATLELLAETVRARHTHPRIRWRMRQLLAGVDRADFYTVLERVWEWVTSQVKYLRDPLGAEHVTDPVTLDRQIDEEAAFEDCESIAGYAATLFAAVGVSSLLEAQGRDPERPKSYRHCSLRVIAPTGEAISFDPVGAHYYPGSFGLGDTIAKPGDPIELWNLDGERIEMRRSSLARELLGDCDLGCARPGMLGAAAPTVPPWVGAITAGSAALRPSIAPLQLNTGGGSSPIPVGQVLSAIMGVGESVLPMVGSFLQPKPAPSSIGPAATTALAVGGGALALKILGVF